MGEILQQNCKKICIQCHDNPDADATDLRHMRAELTALIGDLGDTQEAFVKSLATAVDIKGQYSVSHSRNTAEMYVLIR